MVEVNLSLLVPLILLVNISLAEASRQVRIAELSHSVDDNVNLLHGGPFENVYRPLSRISLLPGEQFADWSYWGNGTGTDESPQDRAEPDHDSEATPSFGRFNHIHGFNTFLLAVTMLVIAYGKSDFTGLLLGLVVAVFWMNLPAIEIDEYDEMLMSFREDRDDKINSLSFHTFLTLVISAPMVGLSYFDISNSPIWARAGGAIIYVGISILVANFYQSFLDNEMQLLVSIISQQEE